MKIISLHTRTISLKLLSLISAMLLLSACTEEVIEWIDVPLTENTYFDNEPVYRTDTIEIPISANADLEYMVDMQVGNSVAYSWEAVDLTDPQSLLAEFHGHTVRTSEEPGDVMFYKQGRGDTSSGYLVAPFNGVHGWYLSNETNSDIKVLLKLSGFYTIP
ncbi:MAG: hypothetical protein ABR72_11915 [OM182 bacterium BACL3 MAG-120920-bin41]|uniref:GOLD domain-containing protein n=4 Tax=OM182 clade TaxID=745002 RepID=A0A0R2T2P0_9GAMM|nr:MAG: hypothetical protein ABR85_02270 [OM182 bacterium BACL3 MAG-120619-bin3]KRO79575.1 MAG: hypothetical protein ABR72_11915 [OM182 bacterium BACL3 MAG-120920-bin41]KRP35347.1 MAG: hypothetical protein ABS26_11615 [OM182 bacterium BACL3 MAG-120531-bin86]